MAEPLNPPHRLRCPGVSDQYVVYTALNTCFNNLRGTLRMPPTQCSTLLLGAMLVIFFALGHLLGLSLAFFAILAALLPLPVEFCASWDAPGSILEGSGRFWEAFWSSQRSFFPRTSLHNDFINAVTTLFHLPALLILPSGAAVCAQHMVL